MSSLKDAIKAKRAQAKREGGVTPPAEPALIIASKPGGNGTLHQPDEELQEPQFICCERFQKMSLASPSHNHRQVDRPQKVDEDAITANKPPKTTNNELLCSSCLPLMMPVFLGYDDRVLGHCSPNPRYPERPNRVSHTARMLEQGRYFSPSTKSGEKGEEENTAPAAGTESSDVVSNDKSGGDKDNIPKSQNDESSCLIPPLTLLAPRLASVTECTAACHAQDEDYLAFLSDSCNTEYVPLPSQRLPSDVHCSPEGDPSTAIAVKASVALTIDAALNVYNTGVAMTVTATGNRHDAERQHSRHRPAGAFCLARPPGHHCSHSPNGFCLTNNVMAAVHQVQQQHGAKTAGTRIAIVDLDVHHGDGTQALVDEHNASEHGKLHPILFISLHRYDQGKFFPHTGHLNAVGPAGYNVNIPFDTCRLEPPKFHSISDFAFQSVFDEIVVPLLRDVFKPDLVFVSCGFDAAEGDPIGGQSVVHGFRYAVSALHTPGAIPSSRGTVCVLEGGYNVESVARRAVDVVDALLHAPCIGECCPVRAAIDKQEKSKPAVWEMGRKRALEDLNRKEEQAIALKEKAVDKEVDEKEPEAHAEPTPTYTAEDLSDEKIQEQHLRWIQETIRRVAQFHADEENKSTSPLFRGFWTRLL